VKSYFKLATLLPSKSADEVVRATLAYFSKLVSEGYPIIDIKGPFTDEFGQLVWTIDAQKKQRVKKKK
jgi:hypothetical protein